MQLSIQHTTQYQYSEPLNYIIQQLRLTPQDGYGQRVKHWSITVNGQLSQHVDTFGNVVHTVVLEGNQTEINLVAKGEVETGFAIKADEERLPLTIYLRDTGLTTPSQEIKAFAEGFEPITSAEILVKLSEAILKRVPYVKGATGVYTSAQQAFEDQKGVCQDHAHIFIACCRSIGVPARYVSGYLFTNDGHLLESHAWADAWIDGTGWVSVDVSNACLVDGAHVRLANGLDYHDACPVSGVRVGGGTEKMDAGVHVNQIGAKQQSRQMQSQIEQIQQ